MTESTTLSELKTSAVARPNEDAPMSLLTGAGFKQIQRVANALASSTLVPAQYRAFTEVKERGKITGYLDNPAGLPNCVVALNMALRMNADPLMVMQNLYVIEGRPSWSSQFIIAQLNSCGRFSPLRFDLSQAGEPEEISYTVNEWIGGNKTSVKKTVIARHQTCTAWVIEKETGERLNGPAISIQMAIEEGWLTKNGSKWQTMPEVMLRYRAASMLGRLYAPELLMGLQSQEEVEDFIDATPNAAGEYAVDINDLRDKAAQAPAVQPDDIDAEFEEHGTDQAEDVNKETGEITPKKTRAKTQAKEKDASSEDGKPETVTEDQAEDPAADVKPGRRQFGTIE